MISTAVLMLIISIHLGLGTINQKTDWLIHPVSQPSEVKVTDTGITLTNGIIERSFFIRNGAFCTIEYRHIIAQKTFFRGISPEANITLNGFPFDIGGCEGPSSDQFEFWNPDLLLANLTSNANAFQFKNYTTAKPLASFEWKPGTRRAAKNIDWPPKGTHLAINFVPPMPYRNSLAGVIVTVHYEMYDGIPVTKKWISVHQENKSGLPRFINTMVIELLRAPNFAPEQMTIVSQQANNPTPFDQQVQRMWFRDPMYDQCCDKALHIPYTLYTFLIIGYGADMVYGSPSGPGANVTATEHFESLSVVEILHDNMDYERQGLAIKRMHRTITPQLLENPTNFMTLDISSTSAFRLAIDQAADVGLELLTIGFGAAGWCGMCFNQLRNSTFKAWFKSQVDYAKSRNIEVTAYTLMQHNGWGEVVPVEEQILSEEGVRGPIACFATSWHAMYRKSVLEFIQDVGLAGLETDGQYENAPCADKSGDHYHNGIDGGFDYQIKATLEFNIALKSLGLYQTGADAYSFSGANRWNHASTDESLRLPIWEQSTIGRMYTYDSTMNRLKSSGMIPIDDLSTMTKDCGGRQQIPCFDFILGTYYAMGIIPNFRTPKLYDPLDINAKALNASIAKWNSFYKKWCNPRPSGASGLLAADIVHIQRPDSRHMEAVVHVTADTSAIDRAMVALVNPTKGVLTADITVPLYYTGIPYGTKVKVTESVSTQTSVEFTGDVQLHSVGENGEADFTDIILTVSLEAETNKLMLIAVD